VYHFVGANIMADCILARGSMSVRKYSHERVHLTRVISRSTSALQSKETWIVILALRTLEILARGS